MRCHERTLFYVKIEFFLWKNPHYLLQICGVLFFGFAIYKYIIKINNQKLANKGLEHLCHKPHKGTGALEMLNGI